VALQGLAHAQGRKKAMGASARVKMAGKYSTRLSHHAFAARWVESGWCHGSTTTNKKV